VYIEVLCTLIVSHCTFIDKLLPESFQTTVGISRVGMANSTIFSRVGSYPPCPRPHMPAPLASLSSVVSAHGLNLYQYADDLSVPVDDAPSAVTRLSQCIADVAEWLSASRLRLNPVIMWLGSKHQVEKVTIHDMPVLQSSTTTVNTARNLGVMLESQLTMSAQVGAACRSAYNYLRLLRPVVQALSVEARKTVVHAFVSLRLDYCNSLLFGVTDSLVQRLQAVQNAAARLVSGTRQSEHITPVLRQLHCYQYGNVLTLRWPFWCIRH